jgi:dsRNA-specific ribonuclease
VKIEIKLQAAKQAIAIPDFKRDDLLVIALTDPADLNHPEIPKSEQDRLKNIYRRLAFLGDALFDAVLANYLVVVNRELTKQDLDDWRQDIAGEDTLTEFAVDLGLPEFSSSWNRKNRKPPESEPRVWGEMFEAVVGVIFIDCDRNFLKLSAWLENRFIRNAIGAYVGDPDYDTTVTTADYLDMIGLEGTLSSVWAPGDDD